MPDVKSHPIDESKYIFKSPNGNVTISPPLLYEGLRSILKLKYSNAHKFYIYDPNTHVYRHLDKSTFLAIIKSYIPIQYRNSRQWMEVYREFETEEPNINENDWDSDEDIIVMKNGIYHLSTGELTKHSEKVISKRFVNCNYIPGSNLGDAPVFREYFHNLCGEDYDAAAMLLEFMGAVISNVHGYKFKKFLIIYGNKDTGKSTYRNLLMALVGDEYNDSSSIAQINERFGTGMLKGCRLVGDGDMDYHPIKGIGVVKALTGSDSIHGEQKFKQKFSFKFTGLLLFSMNNLPLILGNYDDSIYERMVMIKCLNTISSDQKDAKLFGKIWAERDVIISVAIDYLKKAIDRGYRFSESSDMKQAKDDYMTSNNGLLKYVRDCCIASNDYLTRRSDFREGYRIYCAENSLSPEKAANIDYMLKKYLHVIIKKDSEGIMVMNLIINDEMKEKIDNLRNSGVISE